jgi:hypothetical protein
MKNRHKTWKPAELRWSGEYSDHIQRVYLPKRGPNFQPKRKKK